MPYAQALQKPSTASPHAKIHLAGKKWDHFVNSNLENQHAKSNVPFPIAMPLPQTFPVVVFFIRHYWQLLEPLWTSDGTLTLTVPHL